MTSSKNNSRTIDVEACVRGNTGSAALCGALLVFFGFFWFGSATGSGTFLLGDTIFHWTLRGGGLLMIAVAVWCSIGVPIALLLDAFLSIVIGLLLTLSTILLVVNGGFELHYPIYVICAAIFITYGIRDLRDYRKFPSEDDVSEAEDAQAGHVTLGTSGEEPPYVGSRPPAGEPRMTKPRPTGSPGSAADGHRSTAGQKHRPTRR